MNEQKASGSDQAQAPACMGESGELRKGEGNGPTPAAQLSCAG